jgi:hypothetical protein
VPILIFDLERIAEIYGDLLDFLIAKRAVHLNFTSYSNGIYALKRLSECGHLPNREGIPKNLPDGKKSPCS